MDARATDNGPFEDVGASDFLLSEGLELLALYRKIPNRRVRLALMDMMRVIVEEAIIEPTDA